ncbi:universal stress protein [Streptomyces antimycoticus]
MAPLGVSVAPRAAPVRFDPSRSVQLGPGPTAGRQQSPRCPRSGAPSPGAVPPPGRGPCASQTCTRPIRHPARQSAGRSAVRTAAGWRAGTAAGRRGATRGLRLRSPRCETTRSATRSACLCAPVDDADRSGSRGPQGVGREGPGRCGSRSRRPLPGCVSTELASETAVPALLAHDAGSEMLVLGSRGRGAVAGFLLGSIGLQVLGRATCPVVLVRHRGGEAPGAAGGDVVVGIQDPPEPAAPIEFTFATAAAARGGGVRAAPHLRLAVGDPHGRRVLCEVADPEHDLPDGPTPVLLRAADHGSARPYRADWPCGCWRRHRRTAERPGRCSCGRAGPRRVPHGAGRRRHDQAHAAPQLSRILEPPRVGTR